MPDYQFNTNLIPAAQGTSLKDLIATAGGIQQYQQAQQMNPLALKKAQMEIEQAQQVNPLKVRQEQAATQGAEVELDQKQNDALYRLAGSILNDKRLDSNDPKQVTEAINSAKQGAESLRIPKDYVDKAFQPLLSQAENSPSLVKHSIANLVQRGLSAAQQQGLQTPVLTTGPGGAPATYQSGTGTLREATIGGQTGGQAGGGNVGAPTGVTANQMGLQYPVRRAGDIRPMAPNEAVDQEKGVAYRNSLISRQTELPTSRRNLDEVIKEAAKIDKEDLFSTGVLGAVTRTVKGWAGDPKYKQLSKDLANVQIANIQAQGGSMDTVSGQHLQRMANGDETYPPEVLIGIARRTYADLTNLDMQATAAAKFAKKYGDSNLNTFKQQWSKNADSKVFEAMSIFENVKDPVKRKAEIDKLLGSNPEQRQQFFQKYNNIKKLTETGEL
jgi:hypothetical protein